VVEGGGLLNRYTGENLYRGFKSLPLRHPNNLCVSRLENDVDADEKELFVTPQSVELAIKEDQAKYASYAQS
jgi:hypothetical protein